MISNTVYIAIVSVVDNYTVSRLFTTANTTPNTARLKYPNRAVTIKMCAFK